MIVDSCSKLSIHLVLDTIRFLYHNLNRFLHWQEPPSKGPPHTGRVFVLIRRRPIYDD